MRAYSTAVVLTASLVATAAASPPPHTEADVLALEISNTLLAPGEMASQISDDLDAIRAAFPGWIAGVDYIEVSPSWQPGVVLVQMTAEAWADYLAGEFTEFNDLNTQYGPVTISPVALPYTLKIDFTALYHPVLLADIYRQLAGITIAQPNFNYYEGSDITSSQVGRYTFKRGWGDCLSGCMYEHFWEFEVIDGSVTLLAEYGDPTLTGVGNTPLPAALLVGNAPNPFDQSTGIAYRVAIPTHIQLRVYDVSGRLVKSLHDGPAAPGAFTADWNGTDEAGNRVASGIYFCNLAAGGVTQTKKMLVIR